MKYLEIPSMNKKHKECHLKKGVYLLKQKCRSRTEEILEAYFSLNYNDQPLEATVSVSCPFNYLILTYTLQLKTY